MYIPQGKKVYFSSDNHLGATKSPSPILPKGKGAIKTKQK
jgi:hypothetical protein